MKKTVNGVMTNYTLHGKNVVHMTQGSNALHFFYDAQNRPAVVVYNGTAYAYVKNLQGDIVGILDNAGNWVVEYTYDAWGAPTSRTGSMADTLGVINPFRYRGYVYDQETGLYYLRSRYYSATYARCVSADILIAKIGEKAASNLYTYAHNVPISRADIDGADSYYIIYDSRPNATEQEPNNKGLRLQGEWAVQELRQAGHTVTSAGFTTIPEFISAWNNAGNYQYDYIVIYAHGSPGTIDCAGGYLKETTASGLDKNGHECYGSINELEEIRLNKGIYLLSCNGATPDSAYKTAIGMLSIKADGISTTGSAYASINYRDGTGYPYQSPGISWDNGIKKTLRISCIILEPVAGLLFRKTA